MLNRGLQPARAGKYLAAATVAAGAMLMAGCGNSGGGIPRNPPPIVNNTQPIQVNLGPAGNYVNGAFTSVVVCAPGSAQCQTIPDVLVDTGSTGLRILASQMTLVLPQVNDASGNPVGECTQFQDSFVWGPVATADVAMAGEKAASVPVELIGHGAINGNANFPGPPTACTSSGLAAADTVAALGANGVLGIGVFRHDCGTACEGGTSVPAIYFGCPSTGCAVTALALTDQVQNPVWLFPQDNNGVMISLPSISAQGEVTVAGTITFGIGTQSDNALRQAQVFSTDSQGNIVTRFNGTAYPGSFIDTGSNAIFFLDAATTGLPVCTTNSGFYCPTSPASLTATNVGTNNTSGGVNFSIENAESLLNSPNSAFNDLGGPNPGAFDWGLPFFFGRNVFIAINTQSTPAGPGPYYAY